MKKMLSKKLLGILTAFVLMGAYLPPSTAPPTAAAETLSVSELETTAQNTPGESLLTISYITLVAYSYCSVGYDNPFSTQRTQLLDVDGSGSLELNDAYILLVWYATRNVSGVCSEETQTFIDNWNALAGLTTETDTSTQTTTETTVTATVTSFATTTTTSATAIATTATVATTASTTTSTTTTTTTTTTITTTTTTTTAATTTTTKSVYNGIDVSKYQGNIDWTAVKNAGIDYAIIRAGYGKYADQEDPYFDQNMQNAQAAGIACGAYWFSYAQTVDEAVQEAEVFASVIEGYQFEYPLAYDIEASVHDTLSVSEISALVTAFCETMEDKGYYICVYSNANFLSNNISDSVLALYDIWVAHYGVSTPSYTKTTYGMWQYTNEGSVSGISGDVDLDHAYKNYPAIMEKNHLNGF